MRWLNNANINWDTTEKNNTKQTNWWCWYPSASLIELGLHYSLQIECLFGSVALLSHNNLKWSAILGLSFLCGAGGPGFKHT